MSRSSNYPGKIPAFTGIHCRAGQNTLYPYFENLYEIRCIKRCKFVNFITTIVLPSSQTQHKHVESAPTFIVGKYSIGTGQFCILNSQRIKKYNIMLEKYQLLYFSKYVSLNKKKIHWSSLNANYNMSWYLQLCLSQLINMSFLAIQ